MNTAPISRLLAALIAATLTLSGVAHSAAITESFFFPRQTPSTVPLPQAVLPWTFYIPAGDVFEPGGTSFLTIHALGDHNDPSTSVTTTGAPTEGWAVFALSAPNALPGTPVVRVPGVLGTEDELILPAAFDITGIAVSNDLLNLAVNTTTGEVTLSARLGSSVRQDHSSFQLQGQTIPEPTSTALLAFAVTAVAGFRRVRPLIAVAAFNRHKTK
jgi:hypothetical protein